MVSLYEEILEGMSRFHRITGHQPVNIYLGYIETAKLFNEQYFFQEKDKYTVFGMNLFEVKDESHISFSITMQRTK